MEKHYATYDLSKLAKEAGFDEECIGVYKFYTNNVHELEYKYSNTEFISEYKQSWISAPELTHLQQWVYEKFKVWITVKEYHKINKAKTKIFLGSEVKFTMKNFTLCPYEALEKSLLEFLKSKTQWK